MAILQQLHEEDYFDIILFGSVNVFWKKKPVKATKENLSEALEYARNIGINGGLKDGLSCVMSTVLHPHKLLCMIWRVSFPLGTNINDAVLAAVSELVTAREQGDLPERSIDMVILLTDGMPNEGQHID